MTLAQATKISSQEDYVDFMYVYHFRSVFKKGINILQHTYVVDLSNSVEEVYSLDYVLTAAKRWANHRIDDFTLQIDAGEFQDLSIARTFFQHASEWTMSGVGKGLDWAAEKGEDKKTGRAEFFIRSGMLVFKKANFKPDGELHLNAVNSYFYYTKTLDKHTGDGPFKFDYRIDDLPYAIEGDNTLRDAVDELSNKIRRNLPFARRGYIFKSPEIQAYYARQPWYVPDSSYVPVVNQLTRKEQEMVNK